MQHLLNKPILGLTLLLLYLWVGEALVLWANLPVPGSVMGMVLLLVTLLLKGSAPTSVQVASHSLLRHLAMLFVPAAVGAILRLGNYWDFALHFVVLIVLSTLITLAVTAWVLQLTYAKGRRHV